MAYTIRIQGRGDELIYTDAEVRLEMERTLEFGHRLYCDNTAHLPFPKRQQIVTHLCEHFRTQEQPTIFVLDETDKDRDALAAFLTELTTAGHQLTIELDSEEKRQAFVQKIATGTKELREERYGPDRQLRMF
jgi:hypothetical protein